MASVNDDSMSLLQCKKLIPGNGKSSSLLEANISLRSLKLCDSVIGSNTIPLDNFTCNLASRFSNSSRMTLRCTAVAHFTILVSVSVPFWNHVLILLCSTGLHMNTPISWTNNGLRMKNTTLISARLGVQPHPQTALTLMKPHLWWHQPLVPLIHTSAGALNGPKPSACPFILPKGPQFLDNGQ